MRPVTEYSVVMHNRSSTNEHSRDLDQLADSVVGAETSDESEPNAPASDAPVKNPHAAALGRLGGRKGGPARALKLTAERRSEIARKAAQARWHGEQGEQEGGYGTDDR